MIRNIIFDWSGTLVDDLPAVWRASNYVFRQAGVPEISLERFRAEFRLPFTEFYDRYVPGVEPRQLETWFHTHFRECQDMVTALPHARAFLDFCREQGLHTFLLSSVHQEHFQRQLSQTGFGPYLDHCYVGIVDKRRKIQDILASHQLVPAETLFVGDMEHDIQTARHGGVFACAVLTGYNHAGPLRASRPDLMVEHLGELRATLERNRLEIGHPAGAVSLPVATVGALIFHPRTREVLMVRTHKWSNLWGIPGGKIKGGETAEAALRREIKEETNLDVTRIRFVLVQDCIHSPEFYREAHFLLLNYTCEATGPLDVRLNEEANDYRWLTPAAALELPLNQPTRRLLEAVAEQGGAANDAITICDLEISCRVGVTDAERSVPQLLRISVEIEHDSAAAAASDDLRHTVDYYQVSRRLLGFAQERQWALIETLGSDMAELILREFRPARVTVEVKKFVLPEARHVSVRISRSRLEPASG